MGRQLTIGKYLGLKKIANEKGLITITAMDHRGSMKRAINPKDPGSVTYEQMVQLKTQIARHLAPHSSALLLDPLYAAAQLISTDIVPRNTGILVAVEKSGYSGSSTARVSQILPNWGVEKIKRMGANAVKMLLYYNPDAGDLARRQEDLVVQVAEECKKYDIPFLLEPITYPLDPNMDAKGPEFAKLKPDLVIRSAAKLSTLGIDVLKAEFPVLSQHHKDENEQFELCKELDSASEVPWTLLSAGVDYDTFFRQVLISSQAGASGFLAGRAIWQEVPKLPPEERDHFLSTTSVMRLKNITNVAEAYGRPWFEHRNFAHPICPVAEGWYERY
jgi:tagatose 1,6-diphosphate aldolase